MPNSFPDRPGVHDSRWVPMDVSGIKIALFVGSKDLAMPPCPLSHGQKVRERGFSPGATASRIPVLDERRPVSGASGAGVVLERGERNALDLMQRHRDLGLLIVRIGFGGGFIGSTAGRS